MADDHRGLPTPRTTLRAGYLEVLGWRKGGCGHQAPADLQKLVDTGRGDVPLIHLKYRCSNCGSRRTDWVVTSRYGGRPAWDRSAEQPQGEAPGAADP